MHLSGPGIDVKLKERKKERWVDVSGTQNTEQKPDLKAHHNNAVLKDITWVLQFE
jgi:hypothetical protein